MCPQSRLATRSVAWWRVPSQRFMSAPHSPQCCSRPTSKASSVRKRSVSRCIRGIGDLHLLLVPGCWPVAILDGPAHITDALVRPATAVQRVNRGPALPADESPYVDLHVCDCSTDVLVWLACRRPAGAARCVCGVRIARTTQSGSCGISSGWVSDPTEAPQKWQTVPASD